MIKLNDAYTLPESDKLDVQSFLDTHAYNRNLLLLTKEDAYACDFINSKQGFRAKKHYLMDDEEIDICLFSAAIIANQIINKLTGV